VCTSYCTQDSSMYGAPVISGGALIGPTANSGELSSQLMMNRNRATGNHCLYTVFSISLYRIFFSLHC